MASNPNLLTDARVPEWLRHQMQAVSFEAECFATLGVDPKEDTEQGRRFAHLFREAERCANIAVPYIYGNVKSEQDLSAYYMEDPTTNSSDSGCGCGIRSGLSQVLLIGGILAVTCAAGALIVII